MHRDFKCKACSDTGLAPRGWICQNCHGNCFSKSQLNKSIGPKLTHDQFIERLKQNASERSKD